ncbi:MAG: sugar phosphate isomerase/epimerase [Planctomycetaceae bacterium]|nr:sugar phosphate isomerase/epimerase [Planctomycetaceae bacterium]
MKRSIHSVTRRQFMSAAGTAAAATAVGFSVPSMAAENHAKSVPFQLGLASYTTRKFSLEQTIEMAVRLNLKNLCLKSFHLPMDATPAECAAAAKKCKDAGLNLYGGGVITMKTEADVNQAFDYAKAAGMSVIVGVPYPEVLPLVDSKVKEYNIKVAIHNHGPGDKVYPTPESAIERVKDLDPRIGLCVDIGHTVRIGADPIEDITRFADRLHDLHIKDVSAPTKEGETLEIGRGVIDMPAFLRALVKSGYSGIASFEYEKDADDPLPGLAESVGYVRGVLAAI